MTSIYLEDQLALDERIAWAEQQIEFHLSHLPQWQQL